MVDAAAHVTLTLAQREGPPLPSAGLAAADAGVTARLGGATDSRDLPEPLAATGS
jgi:hypothetical protein